MPDTLPQPPTQNPVPPAPQPALPISKKRLVLYLIILIFSLTGSVILLPLKYQQTPPPPAAPSQCQTQDDLTAYTHPFLHFSLRYPSDLELNESTTSASFTRPFISDPERYSQNFALSVRTLDNPNHLSLETIFKNICGQQSAPAFVNRDLTQTACLKLFENTRQDLLVDNNQALSAEYVLYESLSLRTLVENNNQVYFLSLGCGEIGSGINETCKNTFNQILSTFKFTENPAETVNWETYVNEEYQFSLEYPPDWEISDISSPKTASSSNILEIYLGPISNHGDTARFMRIVENTSVEKIIQDLTVNSKFALGHGSPINKITSLNDIYFSGYPAKSLTHRSELTDTVAGNKITDEFHQIIFTKDGLTYIFSWHKDRDAETVNRVLATFKFRQKECPQGQIVSQCKLGPCCCPVNAYCD